VRPAADAIAVLQRKITAAQLDTRTWLLSGQRWRTRTAASVDPRCTGEWGWRQRNGETQREGASELGFDDSLREMRIRVAGAHGGDAWLVGSGCRLAQAVQSMLAQRGRERSGVVGFSSWLDARVREACGRWPNGPWAVSNKTGLGAIQVGRWVTEGRPVYPFSFIHFFSIKFQSSGFKNTNHFLT
jgi:hypothetical protein